MNLVDFVFTKRAAINEIRVNCLVGTKDARTVRLDLVKVTPLLEISIHVNSPLIELHLKERYVWIL